MLGTSREEKNAEDILRLGNEKNAEDIHQPDYEERNAKDILLPDHEERSI